MDLSGSQLLPWMDIHFIWPTWKPKREVWKIIFLFKDVIFRFQPLVFGGAEEILWYSKSHSGSFESLLSKSSHLGGETRLFDESWRWESTPPPWSSCERWMLLGWFRKTAAVFFERPSVGDMARDSYRAMWMLKLNFDPLLRQMDLLFTLFTL